MWRFLCALIIVVLGPCCGLAQLSVARSRLAAAAVGNKAIFAGGLDASGTPVATVDIYDANLGSWSTASLSVARSGRAAVGVGSKVLFAGGADNVTMSNAVDIYDANNGLWTTATLSVARNYLAGAGATGAGKSMFAGGLASTGYSNVVDIYDVNAGTWTTTTLSVARGDQQRRRLCRRPESHDAVSGHRRHLRCFQRHVDDGDAQRSASIPGRRSDLRQVDLCGRL